MARCIILTKQVLDCGQSELVLLGKFSPSNPLPIAPDKLIDIFGCKSITYPPRSWSVTVRHASWHTNLAFGLVFERADGFTQLLTEVQMFRVSDKKVHPKLQVRAMIPGLRGSAEDRLTVAVSGVVADGFEHAGGRPGTEPGDLACTGSDRGQLVNGHGCSRVCAWRAAGGGVDSGQAVAGVQVLMLPGEAGVLVAEPDGVAGVPGAAEVGHGAAGGHLVSSSGPK